MFPYKCILPEEKKYMIIIHCNWLETQQIPTNENRLVSSDIMKLLNSVIIILSAN